MDFSRREIRENGYFRDDLAILSLKINKAVNAFFASLGQKAQVALKNNNICESGLSKSQKIF